MCSLIIEKTLYNVPNWPWWLSYTVIQHFFHSDLTTYYLDMTSPNKQEQEHRLRHSHTTHCIQMWVTHLIVDIKNHLPSMLTQWPLHFIHTTHLYSNGTVTVPQTGTASLPPHLITTISLGQTHHMDTKINHCEESHCLGHSDLNKMYKSQVTVTGPTGHSDLSLDYQPHPRGASPLKTMVSIGSIGYILNPSGYA